jgi:hypothetical protein
MSYDCEGSARVDKCSVHVHYDRAQALAPWCRPKLPRRGVMGIVSQVNEAELVARPCDSAAWMGELEPVCILG